MTEHFDVIVVGAGISGVGAGYRLQTECPTKRYVILEGRADLGGTWDLFRYPGVRSDSDMYTLSYPFRPWKGPRSMVDGPTIWTYIRDTAAEHGIDRHIRFRQRVVRASWSSDDARWTLQVRAGDEAEPVEYTADFLYLCSGYFSYDHGFMPEFPGADRFTGTLVHPQFWPEDLDYDGKQVVVIGSGATAVTLVPAMTERAGHVTMLQRSPSYVVSLPGEDPVANLIQRRLPERVAAPLVRWFNVVFADGAVPALPACSPVRPQDPHERRAAPAPAPTTPSTRTSRRSTTRGTSGCASCPTVICSWSWAPVGRRS